MTQVSFNQNADSSTDTAKKIESDKNAEAMTVGNDPGTKREGKTCDEGDSTRVFGTTVCKYVGVEYGQCD